jgi:hypothetical protein
MSGPRRDEDTRNRLEPISVNLIKGLGGWMHFVLEGQHDSSQVRSAWVAIQKDPVPEGRSKSLSAPEIFVVETELMPLQKRWCPVD